MTTDHSRLRVQAWLDGELPAVEAGEVSRWVETDAEAATLARELRQVRSWLAAGELPRRLVEPRELYWSQIRRAIEPVNAPEADVEGAHPPMLRWLRWLVPAGLAAALAVVWFSARPLPTQNASLRRAEIDSPQEDSGTITFRSDREQMTVVWIGNP
jgi:anti-sigma factor RsiW